MTDTTVKKAAQATTKASAAVEEALAALDGISGREINGHGVYSDPSRCHQAMAKARASLDVALAAMAGTAWPTDSDYDAAE